MPATSATLINGMARKLSARPAIDTREKLNALTGKSTTSAQIAAASRPRLASNHRVGSRSKTVDDASFIKLPARRRTLSAIASVAPNDNVNPTSTTVAGTIGAIRKAGQPDGVEDNAAVINGARPKICERDERGPHDRGVTTDDTGIGHERDGRHEAACPRRYSEAMQHGQDQADQQGDVAPRDRQHVVRACSPQPLQHVWVEARSVADQQRDDNVC